MASCLLLIYRWNFLCMRVLWQVYFCMCNYMPIEKRTGQWSTWSMNQFSPSFSVLGRNNFFLPKQSCLSSSSICKNSRDLMILHHILIVSTWLSVCESVFCLLVGPNSYLVTSAQQCGSASRYLPYIPSCWKLQGWILTRFTWLSSWTKQLYKKTTQKNQPRMMQTVWSVQPLCVPMKSRKKLISNLNVHHQNTSRNEGIPGL